MKKLALHNELIEFCNADAPLFLRSDVWFFARLDTLSRVGFVALSLKPYFCRRGSLVVPLFVSVPAC